ncbi:MAG TPA: AAA family ATPase [Steroidobacteraceae bacterium]|nr:AAA family ATPase [Steroidobacteraceae bacterium]
MSDTGGNLIERLLSPDAYPHAVEIPIRVAETHISWVLLTGPYAYKIKKPVRLSFLDYSSLELRRTCCEEELRLNRRYAPDLYLAVAAIAGPASAPRVDGAAQPIEYAVRMRQFDQRQELDALVASDAVGVREIAALGSHIARFHAGARPVDPATPFGRPDAVHRFTTANFAELRRLPEAQRWTARLQDLERRVTSTFDEHRDFIAARRSDDRVRECHGDLHCGNVVRWSGELTPFDGIEFDPALRFIDVANDLAFLTMDLSERGRDDLRHAALQAWAAALGDFAAVRVLPYFEAYRALVRAKVAALRALQLDAGSAERERDVSHAARYLDWAAGRARRGKAGLMLTCGYSGSGKTWLAEAVARELHALHVRSDVERKRLAGLGPLDDSRSPPDAGIYTRDYTVRTYGRLRECAADVMRGGENVVVDAAYLRRDERERMLALARELGLPAVVLHCTAPMNVMRDRVARRAASRTDASEAGVATLERQVDYWEPFAASEAAHVLDVDTSAPDAVAACVAELRRRGFRPTS